MESIFLVLRVIISLAAVFGLLFYLRKRVLSRFGTPRATQLSVVERQGLGPKSSVVLLDVQGRRYLLGVAESSISVLDSFEAPEPVVPDPLEEAGTPATMAERSRAFAQSLNALRQGPATTAAAEIRAGDGGLEQPATTGAAAPASPAPAVPTGPLAGSILSPETWRRAAAALRSGRGA
ncbi:FliO/MopB family protein [Paeniglutamicibacter psychrophenolicus]|uniref:FliO/MopB family protein n=1 Tax=Paeniglutamicibacter psychrophenolicus TaxID=257454 RepID=UPI00277DFF60|nr:flagellar biosynthetic protein FliO [Paeniglutamicibacter psychrophenolicus]MDQ0094629.1 flagellar protein FliO/FliZ [Paeniglutamicibacter psychrophenolicus]